MNQQTHILLPNIALVTNIYKTREYTDYYRFFEISSVPACLGSPSTLVMAVVYNTPTVFVLELSPAYVQLSIAEQPANIIE
jgi:hypothetical protein